MKKVNPVKMGQVDVLAGGFPCQSFSIAGYMKGFEDDRGNLFFDILRFVDILRPSIKVPFLLITSIFKSPY